MTEILLDSLVPIYTVMALGYFAGWRRVIDNQNVAALNALVMDFALPASLFLATASASRRILMAQWPLLLVLAVSMLTLYALCYWMQRRLFGLDSGAASVQTLTISLPNYAAVGLTLIPAVIDASHTMDVALAIAAGTIVLSPLTLAILEANKSAAGGRMTMALILRAVGRSLLRPIVLAPIVGVAFSLLGIPLPKYVGDAFRLIGQAAGGVALFLTGLIVSAQRLLLDRNVISGTLLKNVGHPLLASGLLALLPMAHDTARAALLLAALPSGFFGTLFGLRYGIKSQEAGSTLIVSSVLGAFTLAIALILTSSG